MATNFRVVVEKYSDDSPDKVERKVVDERAISPVESIFELGYRHEKQIELLQDIQDQLLASQKDYAYARP